MHVADIQQDLPCSPKVQEQIFHSPRPAFSKKKKTSEGRRRSPEAISEGVATRRQHHNLFMKYRKIPKISPRAYIFQRPFLRGVFLEGLLFEGAYLRRGLSMEGNLCFKIEWASLTVGRKFTVFALFNFVFEGNFQVQAPRGLIYGGAI